MLERPLARAKVESELDYKAVRQAGGAIPRFHLQSIQLEKLNQLLARVLPKNDFYRERFGDITKVDSLETWGTFPLISKSELIDPASDFARNHTFAPEHYTRLHRTSGTHGKPMIVMDTSEDWQWWLDTWQYVWGRGRSR